MKHISLISALAGTALLGAAMATPAQAGESITVSSWARRARVDND